MRKHKSTVTVAVCAFNEEKNIAHFLKSVLKQKCDTFVIKKILIISDGSTDRTAEKVKGFHSPLIEFVESRKRLGKSSHLNYIYQNLKTDFLVQTDADVIFKSNNVIKHLIQPLIENKKVMMCGGNPVPLKGRSFVENAINLTTEAYRELRFIQNNGDNVFSADGRLLAYRKKFVKEIYVPHDMIANDMFTYFCCRAKGYIYKFAYKAVVTYRSPRYLRDHVRQDTRFRAAPMRMEKYFSKDLVTQELTVPLKTLGWLYIKHAFSRPVHALFIFFINQYIRLSARKNESTMTAKWKMAFTTKEVI